MQVSSIAENRKNGIFYTPPLLAEFLAKPLINKAKISVFDPAYGEGALLLAAEEIYKKRNQSNEICLFGCDISPINGLLKHLPLSNLLELDFFNYPVENTFDVILMNPPYVRHHLLGRDKIKKYQDQISSYCNITHNADLWVYFIVKSIAHLKQGGSLGAILPWSFLQADYARDLRSWLSGRFQEIKVLALGTKYFDNAKERVLLLWLNNYGNLCNSIKITSSKDVNDSLSFIDVSLDKWESDKVIFNAHYDVDDILRRYVDEYGFKQFENYASVRIGVVTGADKYFIISDEEANALGFTKNDLIPILTTSRKLSSFCLNSSNHLKNLIIIKAKGSKKFESYITEGKNALYHLRSHSIRRSPWYAVNVGATPDAFFPYRMSKFPYLVLNAGKTQCTNSIHRIYFKNVSEIERKWIQVSLLSVAGQLSLERHSKTYGRGLLKIEPTSLKNAIAYKDKDSQIDNTYFLISQQLSLGNKLQAMRMATEFIDDKLGIPKELSESAEEALYELQNRRIDT